MVNFLGSLFCFWCVWVLCEISSSCNYAYLNRKFHITIRHKLLERILLPDLSHSSNERNVQAQHQMGIVGILAYAALLPSALYVWITEGSFLFFVTVNAVPIWYAVLFWSILLISLLNYWIGYYLAWREQKKAEKIWRTPAIPCEILWSGTEPPEEKNGAEEIFRAPDKVIWDMDAQEFYYLQGKMLLRLRVDGAFISLTPETDSPRVLKAMRTGNFIKF